MWQYYSPDELYHHGILGMKWGKRNGPPYPLGSGQHSAAERKAGSKGWSKEAQDQFKTTPKSSKNQNGIKSERKPSSKDLSNYRAEMVKQYSKTDPKKAKEYQNASEAEIQKEYARREKLKKTLLTTAAVAGIAAGCYIAYRSHATKQIAAAGITKIDDVTKPVAEKIMQESLDDMDYVIKQGSVMHRMSAFSNFDVSKTSGKLTYTTVTEADRAGYMAFLKDWHGTGKRYDISLEALKDIKAPGDDKAKEIFQKIYTENPAYKEALEKTLKETYAKLSGRRADDPLIAGWVKGELAKDPFKTGMYALVKGKDDSRILVEAYKKHGYSAIVDYFDRGTMGEQPMILFDAATDVVKKGEQYVTTTMKAQSIRKVASTPSHPLYKSAKSFPTYLQDKPFAEYLNRFF